MATGNIPEADALSEDGRFVMVARQSSGLISPYWGFHRANLTSPNQIHVKFQPQGSGIMLRGAREPACLSPDATEGQQSFDVTFYSPSQMATSNGVGRAGIATRWHVGWRSRRSF